MKRFWFIATLGVLAACRQPQEAHTPVAAADEAPALPIELGKLPGTWLLDPASSHGDTLAYRPNTYRFPYRPGGRPGFRLGPGQRFTRYELAPGGGLLAQEGTWTENSSDEIAVHLPDLPPAQAHYTIHFLRQQNGVLTLVVRQP